VSASLKLYQTIKVYVYPLENKKEGIEKLDSLLFSANLWRKFRLLLHMALGTSGGTRRFVGLFRFIMAALAGFMKNFLC